MLLVRPAFEVVGMASSAVRFVRGIRPNDRLAVRGVARRAGDGGIVWTGEIAGRVAVLDRGPSGRQVAIITVSSGDEVP